uniref:Uncharacterized protein n=2 Tax=unclassified bacterial viruses TaxID=12333 RepID=A0AAU6W488_9VIRU
MNKAMLDLINTHPVGGAELQLRNKEPAPRPFISEHALNAAVLGAQNINSAISTIDELRQQLADVSNERDGLRAAHTELEQRAADVLIGLETVPLVHSMRFRAHKLEAALSKSAEVKS